MNYLIGYLYITLRNEEVSYKIFHTIMNKYFKQVLSNQLENMQLKFYQFNRIFSFFLPELYKHFMQQKIDTHYYPTSWIITLFSQSYQYTMESFMVTVIWDLFIVEGWKGFFKSAMFILGHFQSALLQMDFDQILHFMSGLVKNDLFILDQKALEEKKVLDCATVKSSMLSIKISNKLLVYLEQDYNNFQIHLKKKN